MAEVVSAGGVVLSPLELHIERSLLVVNREGGFGLPKGKPEEGESLAGAAVRELWEETGIIARIIELAGSVEYEANRYDEETDELLGRVRKEVVLFHMEALCQGGPPEPGSQPLWVPVRLAIAGMHHREVGEFLKRVLPLEDIAADKYAVADGQQYQGGAQHYYGVPALKPAA